MENVNLGYSDFQKEHFSRDSYNLYLRTAILTIIGISGVLWAKVLWSNVPVEIFDKSL